MHPQSKSCSRCRTDKPLDAFNHRTDTRDGRSYICRECQRAVAAVHYSTHKLEKNQRALAWRAANPDRVRAARRALIASKRAADPEAFRREQRRAMLWTQYRITPEQFGGLLALQGGRCGICGTTDATSDAKPFRVDHDHGSREVRGILCHLCNVLLGAARDDPHVLRAAIAYLAKAPDAGRPRHPVVRI